MLESLGLVSMHRSKASENNEEEVENKLFLSPLLSHFLSCISISICQYVFHFDDCPNFFFD